MSDTKPTTISEYNELQNSDYLAVCNALAAEIDKELVEAHSKIWHGAPVWFIDDNPIVGYSVRKQGVSLLFWSGQSFDENGLESEGSFKAAQKFYHTVSDINSIDVNRWLKKSRDIQWDYKNIVKRRGELVRIVVE